MRTWSRLFYIHHLRSTKKVTKAALSLSMHSHRPTIEIHASHNKYELINLIHDSNSVPGREARVATFHLEEAFHAANHILSHSKGLDSGFKLF